jgi:acyl-CoA dehydrogenase
MAWDFETDPEFQEKLDWADEFVRREVEPLDLAFRESAAAFNRKNPVYKKITDPLKAEVRKQGLWACHLGPELGGKGYGQVKLGLLNEILGRSAWAPNVFGCQAPDSGNAEILAHYGTEAQKKRYLQPLLDGELTSCFSMTEPQAGADPKEFKCRAVRDGDDWVINGDKFFSSHADFADFLICMAITNPDVPVYQGASMILIPAGTPGVNIVRNVGIGGEPLGEGHHPHVRYEDCRVPADHLLGGEGQAFVIAQTRLGGGRIHHAMRTVATVKKALRMMCERALSRRTQGEELARKQMVQEKIADSFIQLEQFRLLVMYAAWHIDKGHKSEARTYIAAVKVQTAEVMHDVVRRALHLHGALGCSNEMPLIGMWNAVPVMAIADGPTEVHKITVARQVLKQYEPYEGLWPRDFLPERVAEARARYAEYLEHEVGNL